MKHYNRISILILVVLSLLTGHVYAEQLQNQNKSESNLVPYVPPEKKIRPDLKSPETRRMIIKQAFGEEMDKMLPLLPAEIQKQKTKIQATEKAIRQNNLPPAVTSSKQLILESGVEIPEILFSPGHVTAIVFIDSTGADWPITSAIGGNSGYFKIKRPAGLKPGNMITIQSLQNFASSNVIITLADCSFPIVIKLRTTDLLQDTSKAKTDYLVSYRVTKRGPLAKMPIAGPPPKSVVDEITMSFLDGIPPKNAEFIDSISKKKGMNMWRYKGLLYLRTIYSLVWPAYTNITHGSEGVVLYQMPDVPEILISNNGEKTSLSVNYRGSTWQLIKKT